MIERLTIYSGRLSQLTLAALLARIGQWWMREFLNLLSERTSTWLVDQEHRALLLSTEGDDVVLKLLAKNETVVAPFRVSRSQFDNSMINQFITLHGIQREHIDLGVRLPQEKFFGRKVIVPYVAINAIEQILAMELARKTPFRMDEIVSDYVIGEPSDGDKIAVWQWVVRRQFVAQAAEQYGISLDELSFVDSDGSIQDEVSPFVRVRARKVGKWPWMGKVASGLAASAVLLAILAGGLKYWRQQVTIDGLEAQTAATRIKAQQVRSAAGLLEEKQTMLLRLRTLKRERPGLLDVWRESTRVLPSHTWLMELRLSEAPENQQQWITMTGLSGAASSLVALLDRSPLFADASLTAPTSFDPVLSRERFALQARVKAHSPLAKAAK